MIQQRWRLRCFGCSEPIELPDQNPKEKYEHLPDQPTDTWPITVVCRNFGHQHSYERPATPAQVWTPEQGQQIDVLWCVEFRCDPESCGKETKIYTSAEHFLDNDELACIVLRAVPVLRCAAGHAITKKHVKVVRQVIWIQDTPESQSGAKKTI